MQVTETLNDGLKRGYDITVTAAEIEAKVNEKLEEAQPEIEMKGFRKGKVPMALLKKQFGQRLLGEAMQESIDGAMSQHFEDSGDRPAAQPKIEMTNKDWKEGDDVQVSMTYEALPDIPEVDLKAISLEKLVTKADDDAVDEAVKNLAASAKVFEHKGDGAEAEMGDQVVFDFKGSVDGEEFEGGAAEDFPLELGSGQFIPGFEEQLVGVVENTDKTVTVTFPEGYNAEHLAGKEAEFACTIKAVKKPGEAEIDDELAKRYGAEGLDALKTQIRERIDGEYGGAARQVMKRKLLDILDDTVSFELPDGLVSVEANQIARQLWQEENPDTQPDENTEIEPTEEHTKLAERRVRLGLLLAELGQKSEVEVSDAEFTQAVMTQARQYPGQEREFFEFVQKTPEMQQQIRAPLFEDKVVDYIFELAEVTEKEVSKDDLKAAIDALEDDDPTAKAAETEEA